MEETYSTPPENEEMPQGPPMVEIDHGASWSKLGGWLLLVGMLLPILFAGETVWIWDMFEAGTEFTLGLLFLVGAGVAGILAPRLKDPQQRGALLLGLVGVMFLYIMAKSESMDRAMSEMTMAFFSNPVVRLAFLFSLITNFVAIHFIKQNPENRSNYYLSGICGLVMIVCFIIPEKNFLGQYESTIMALFMEEVWEYAWGINLYYLMILIFAGMSVGFLLQNNPNAEYPSRTFTVGRITIVAFPVLLFMTIMSIRRDFGDESGDFVWLMIKVFMILYGIGILAAAGLLNALTKPKPASQSPAEGLQEPPPETEPSQPEA